MLGIMILELSLAFRYIQVGEEMSLHPSDTYVARASWPCGAGTSPDFNLRESRLYVQQRSHISGKRHVLALTSPHVFVFGA